MKISKALPGIIPIVLSAAMLCACAQNSADGTPEKTEDSFSEDTAQISEADSDLSSADDETDSQTESKAENAELFDVSPIVEAYHTGDTSQLTELETEIYVKACSVLDEIISDKMTAYEKELAVHDWLIINCTYDKGSLSAIPNPSENCDNPYGALINGQAICSGYSTSFRMFMGMLDIPCGTIHSCDINDDEHAWNTVKLDGSWYYVDVTWDDPVPDFDGRPVCHTYFNVSREEIAARHILTESSPDTDSLENSFFSRSAVEITELDEIYPLAEEALKSGSDSIVLLFDSSLRITFDGCDLTDDEYLPDDKKLSKAVTAAWNSLKQNGIIIKESAVIMRRVQTDRGIGLSVRFCQYA